MNSRTLLAALLIGAAPVYADDFSIPDFYDNSAYSLTRVEQAGDNTITKFEYNTATQTFEPVFYRVDLKQTEFGEGSLSQEFQIPILQGNVNIKFNYDDASTGNYEHVYKDITKDLGTVTDDDIPEDWIINRPGGVVEIDQDSIVNAIFQNNTIIAESTASGESYSKQLYLYFKGGAIYNDKELSIINADFIGNSLTVDESDGGSYTSFTSGGGAIYNDGSIHQINGNFINNLSTFIHLDYGAWGDGAAIYNAGKIDNINGLFYNNSYDTSYDDNSFSNVILNDYRGEIGNINAYFLNNPGTALSNSGTIETVQSTFIGNSSTALGNGGRIVNINSDFIGNGTGISNNGYIGTITGNFVGQNNGITTGGGTIEKIKANFIGSQDYGIYNGYSYGTNIGSIESNFVDNGVAIYSNKAEAHGGYVNIDNISSNFINNITAIYNTNTTNISQISNSLFVGNSGGGAIVNTYNTYGGGIIGNYSTIDKIINSDFYNNSSISNDYDVAGGAIYNTSNIGEIANSSFYNNYAQSENGTAKGGAIYSTSDIHITAEDGGQSIFSGNYTESNGVQTPNAIYLDATPEQKIEDVIAYIDTQSVVTQDITTKAIPTLILDASTNGVIQFDDPIDGTIENTETITTTGDLTVSQYYIDDYGSTVEEFIESAKTNQPYWYYENMTDEEILQTAYDRNWLVATNEQSSTEISNNAYSLHITGDETGKVILNNDVTAHTYDDDGNVTAQAPVNISLENTNLYLGARDDIFDGNNLNLKSGFMSMVNDSAGISALNNLTVSGDVNFAADVDLANKEMDRFTAAEYGEHTGNINVVGMNLLSDAVQGESVTAVYFAEPDLKNNVVNGTGDLPDSFQTTAYTPIYKYNVIYDKDNQYDGKGDGGYFVFAKGDIILPDEPDEPDEPNLPVPPTGGGTTGNPSDAFNPAVLATPVGNLAAGQAAMNEAFKYVFEHADAFTQLPSMERYAKINANKYALSTDFNDNLPSYAEQLHNNAVWFRPYTTFETMNIKNGPKVDAITYGSLVGFDGDFKEMKNGWSRIFTGYAGYMGSSLNYSGVDTTMNGGLLGFTETFYKGNFWTAITASAGASVGESHTMYGKEDYTSLLAGVGSKTGYNFEFKDGKFIIQPIMFLSYTFVNTFDYKNAAGVNIESDPLHTIQLNPSVRFIANLKGGWQPYASVGMVWNLMNESKVTANNVKLPEMSVKPYVEYGVGVQRNWADKFTAFLQAMIRNGGRNGVALTGGFRFMLGSEPKNSDKPKVKKEIKSL